MESKWAQQSAEQLARAAAAAAEAAALGTRVAQLEAQLTQRHAAEVRPLSLLCTRTCGRLHLPPH
jgi:hypothetical protein